MILENITPRRVWYYFEEISNIPRESGNHKPMTDYCKAFAAAHGLEFIQDAMGNIVLRKPASVGYEAAEGVVLQGHMDMVCVKTKDSTHDFDTDGIELCTDGTKIWANGTSLGADDGIAMAYAFAILESADIAHPALEVLFTVEEEVGLLGASGFDAMTLRGTRLLNLDSEEEGILTVSCAGGVRALCTLPVERVPAEGTAFRLSITGLQGGHSGMEIDKGHVNANKLLGRILNQLFSHCGIQLVSMEGGTKENAIPDTAQAVFCTKNPLKTLNVWAAYSELLKRELAAAEPDLELSMQQLTKHEAAPQTMFSEEATRKALFLLYHCPDGMQKKNPELEGMVQTSLNAGVLRTTCDAVTLRYSIRSAVASEKQELEDRIFSFMQYVGGTLQLMADYPAWEYRRESALRDITVQAYRTVYGKEPQICGIHAGLECGIFSGRNPKLDCISFGPQLYHVHTPEEAMDIASAVRTWELLLEILRISK